jgi:hypothetical protein
MTGAHRPVAIIRRGRCGRAGRDRTVRAVVAILLLPLWACGLLAVLLGMQAVEGWLERPASSARGSSRSDDAQVDQSSEG